MMGVLLGVLAAVYLISRMFYDGVKTQSQHNALKTDPRQKEIEAELNKRLSLQDIMAGAQTYHMSQNDYFKMLVKGICENSGVPFNPHLCIHMCKPTWLMDD